MPQGRQAQRSDGHQRLKADPCRVRWGFKKDLVDRDVSAKLDKPAEERRLTAEERILTDDELRQLWLGVDSLPLEMSTFIRLPLLFRTTDLVRRATGVTFGLHDLRATCATGVRRMSGLPHVPALVLGHQGVPGVPDVTSRYDRADTVPEVASALNAWAAHIEGLLLEERPVADVVPIRTERTRGSA